MGVALGLVGPEDPSGQVFPLAEGKVGGGGEGRIGEGGSGRVAKFFLSWLQGQGRLSF